MDFNSIQNSLTAAQAAALAANSIKDSLENQAASEYNQGLQNISSGAIGNNDQIPASHFHNSSTDNDEDENAPFSRRS